jgi:hypothetical protein
MGVSHSAAELGAKLKQAENVLGDAGTRKSLGPVADRVRGVMLRSAAGAGLRPGSKIAGRPWRGVYVRNEGTKNLAVGYASPAQLVNNKTRAHLIGARKLGTRKAISKRVTGASLVSALTGTNVAASFRPRDITKGAKALHFGGTFAAYVRSPGTRGKRFFEKAIPQAQKEGADEMGRTVNRALTRIFG